MNTRSDRSGRLLALVFSLIAGSLAGFSTTAHARSITEIQPGSDVVQGTLDGSGDHLLPFRLVEGARVSFKVKADRGSALLPEVSMLDTTRAPHAPANDGMKISRKGNLVSLKNLTIEDTGLYYLRIGAAEGSSGSYTMTMKVKQPRKATAEGTFAGGGASSATFTAPGNALATISVKSAKGSGAAPSFGALHDPSDDEVAIDEVRNARTGFQLKRVALGAPGVYTIHTTSPRIGDYTVTAKFKVPKAEKRILDGADVIPLPVVNAVSPSGGARDHTMYVDVDVDFVRDGAVLEFRRSPTVVTIPANLVTHGDDGVTALVDLEPFQRAVYDVVVINPDGGESVLPYAFEVENAVAQPMSISPSRGKDDQRITATVTGSFLEIDASISLRRGEETIEGTGAWGGGGSLFVDFDLRDRPLGAWDVVIVNPGAEHAVMDGAFTIEPAAELLSMTPDDNRDGLVVNATITGNGFEGDEMSARLLPHDGKDDDIDPVVGTNLAIKSLTTMTVDFDTIGTDGRIWDLEVTFPGDVTILLEDVFMTRGRIGGSSGTSPFVQKAEAPHSVVYNAERDEYAVAWVEMDPSGIIPWWTLVVQRYDAQGQAVGAKAAPVSSGFQGSEKQHIDIGWDADNDEYLVAWSEASTVTMSTPPKGVKHPRGAGNLPTYEVFIQRLKGSDLSRIGSSVQVTNHVAIPNGSMSPWYVDEFHNFRPQVAWDRLNSLWEIVWMQEFDITLNSKDDYNALGRSYDPATGGMGTLVGHGVTPMHEGDPEAAWDPVNEIVWVFFNAAMHTGGPLHLFAEAAGGGQDGVYELYGDPTSDLADPRVAVDTESERLLLTWTRIDYATNRRSIEGLLLDGEDLTSALHGPVTIGEDLGDPEQEKLTEDHLLARP
ncbi:MAG: hypothetical protein ACYTG4_13020, partial [Planctomycetota bacterium]